MLQLMLWESGAINSIMISLVPLLLTQLLCAHCTIRQSDWNALKLYHELGNK